MVHVEEGAGLKLVCQFCGKVGAPNREFLSKWRDIRYESARCPGCGKEIAGIVVRGKKGGSD